MVGPTLSAPGASSATPPVWQEAVKEVLEQSAQQEAAEEGRKRTLEPKKRSKRSLLQDIRNIDEPAKKKSKELKEDAGEVAEKPAVKSAKPKEAKKLAQKKLPPVLKGQKSIMSFFKK